MWLPFAVGLLRAKTRKRLEAMAAAAAAAGTPGAASLSPSCWPSASGAASRSAAGGASGSGGTGTAAGITGISTTTADGGSGCAGVGAGAGCEAVGGSSRSPAGELEGLVGARQRMTSTLMLQQLTQDVQVCWCRVPRSPWRFFGIVTCGGLQLTRLVGQSNGLICPHAAWLHRSL